MKTCPCQFKVTSSRSKFKVKLQVQSWSGHYHVRVDPLLVAYVSFTALLVVTPGATTAVIVRNTLAGGWPAGIAAATGAALGNTSHAMAAGLGLAVVFTRWPTAMLVLRLSGAVYLAWLGLRSIYRVIRHADGGLRVLSAADSSPVRTRQGTSSLREGLTVNLLNPAIATFYLVVVPSFVPAGTAWWSFAGLAAIHVALAFVCHGFWAVGLDKLRRLFRSAAARRALEAASGLALLGLAVRVLVS